MKKKIVTIFVILILAGCKDINPTKENSLPKTEWSRQKLKGRVQIIEKYKTDFMNPKAEGERKTLLISRKEFTEKGALLKGEYFNESKKIDQYIENKYNNEGFKIGSIQGFTILETKLTENFELDPLTGKPVNARIIQNDPSGTTEINIHLKYNSQGDPIKQWTNKEGEISTTTWDYKYNDKGKIVYEKQIESDQNGDIMTVFFFKYDKDNNLIEQKLKSDNFPDYKFVYEYRKNLKKKGIKYSSNKIDSIESFDKYGNTLSTQFFVNEILNRELIYKYKFDFKGNWEKRKIYLQDSEDLKKSLIYIETRKIKYFPASH